jgi:hypothetical protein
MGTRHSLAVGVIGALAIVGLFGWMASALAPAPAAATLACDDDPHRTPTNQGIRISHRCRIQWLPQSTARYSIGGCRALKMSAYSGYPTVVWPIRNAASISIHG